MTQTQAVDSLTSDRLQLFAAGLAGLPKDEIRKAKVLYIRNAITDWRAMKATMSAFGCLQVFFLLIPIFWPILFLQRRVLKIAQTAFLEKIRNAMEVWRDDLQGERFELDDL